MKKAKRDPKMMTNVKKNVKKMRMVLKMRTRKVPGASDDSMSVGGVHGVSLLFTTGPLCSTPKLTLRYWQLPPTKCKTRV
jgi:hypothetical protein